MKRLVWLVSCVFLLSCGDEVPPPLGGNNASSLNNTNNTNNQNNQNNINNRNNTDACVDDQTCRAGFACVESTCQASCTDRQPCRDDQECVSQPDGDGKYCVPASNNRVNNTNNTSNNVAGAIEVVLVRDTTTDQAACASQEPGADIFWIRLEDQGSVVGSGLAGLATPGDAPNGNTLSTYDHIDGQQQAAPDTCPTLDDPFLYALGCGGTLVVSFQGIGGAAMSITAGVLVSVFEYGAQCGASLADSYEVLGCTDTAATVNGGDLSSCTVNIIANGSGQASGIYMP